MYVALDTLTGVPAIVIVGADENEKVEVTEGVPPISPPLVFKLPLIGPRMYCPVSV